MSCPSLSICIMIISNVHLLYMILYDSLVIPLSKCFETDCKHVSQLANNLSRRLAALHAAGLCAIATRGGTRGPAANGPPIATGGATRLRRHRPGKTTQDLELKLFAWKPCLVAVLKPRFQTLWVYVSFIFLEPNKIQALTCLDPQKEQTSASCPLGEAVPIRLVEALQCSTSVPEHRTERCRMPSPQCVEPQHRKHITGLRMKLSLLLGHVES